jgi:hypothetical protein
MDSNNPNQPTLPQENIPQPNEVQQPTSIEQPQSPITNQQYPNNNQPTTQTQTQTNSDTNSEEEDENYTEDFGNYIIELLDDISADENLTQKIANKMGLDKEETTEILENILQKIDDEQITPEELALIMTAPIVDERSDNE